MRGYIILALVILVLAFPIGAEPESEEKWIKYEGHGMCFEYPESWGLEDGPTGVTLGDPGVFGLSIVMHREGCYQLLQHPQLLDFMLKMWGTRMDGTPDGEPITQFYENEIGPYSNAMQIYKDPDQMLMCELQGYTAKNVTMTYAYALWEPKDPAIEEVGPMMSRLQRSLIVTLPDN
jgi:hypothetical protein